MVSKCANPACSTPLLRLRDGKLFQFEVRSISVPFVDSPQGAPAEVPTRQVAHYWLCGPCSEQMSLTLDVDGVQVVSLPPNGQHQDDNQYAMSAYH